MNRGLSTTDTARVENAFAKDCRERARFHDWIQLDNAQWVRKT
jgi:hypothetical protein